MMFRSKTPGGTVTKILFVPSCNISTHNILTPTDTLIRCEKGLKLWQDGSYDFILVSGGIFNPPNVQSVPAGDLMAEWFERKGVPKERIIVENKSLDTFENIRLSLLEMGKHGIDLRKSDITIVTQWQHAWRFVITFLFAHGIRIKRIPLHYKMSFLSSIKEYLFILYHLWDWRGDGVLAKKNRADRRQAKPA